MIRESNKVNGIFSVILVLVVFLVVTWTFNTTVLYLLQKQFLFWNYYSHVLMVALGVGVIALTGRNFRSYGFTLENWRSDFSIAVICVIAAAGFIPSLLFPVIASNDVLNAIFSIGATLLALWAVLKKGSGSGKSGLTKTATSLMALAPLFSLAAVAFGMDYPRIASTAIFQFFFAGFGEEILFRGYLQSRLNESFGKQWKFAGVDFGPGLLITSILFGVLHLLNPFNPLVRQYALAAWSGIDSMVAGILFGFVREKTGDVLSSSLAHGLFDLGQVIPLLF